MDSIEEVRNKVLACTKCRLSKGRKNAVPGDGNPQSRIVFIGEAPGASEDEEGKPFVGAAGKLLNSLIKDILGLERSQVYITNVVKCRPPNNRDPQEDEILACSDYLDSEIQIIKPKIVVTLGRHSTSYIFNKANIKFTSITKVRGREFHAKVFGFDVIILPTYHPAAALYNPRLREELEKDFMKIREILGLENKKRTTLDLFLGIKDGSGPKGEKGNSYSIK